MLLYLFIRSIGFETVNPHDQMWSKIAVWCRILRLNLVQPGKSRVHSSLSFTFNSQPVPFSISISYPVLGTVITSEYGDSQSPFVKEIVYPSDEDRDCFVYPKYTGTDGLTVITYKAGLIQFPDRAICF